MTRSTLYLILAAAGALVPWIFLADFLAAHGAAQFIPSLFVNGAAGGLTIDLLISSFTFWLFLFHEGRRRGVRFLWLYVVVNLLIGLSCALPLFLAARERSVTSS